MTKSWTEEMINNFSSLSEDGGFLIRTSDYMPDLDAVEKFISTLLDKQGKEICEELEGIKSFTIDDWYVLDYEDTSSIEAIDKKDLDQAITKIKGE